MSTMTTRTTPIKLKTNEFWGKQSGTIHPIRGLIFKGKRAGSNKRDNQGKTGRKANRQKRYANKKLNRLGRRMS